MLFGSSKGLTVLTVAAGLLLTTALPAFAKHGRDDQQRDRSQHQQRDDHERGKSQHQREVYRDDHRRGEMNHARRVPPGHVKQQLRHDEWMHYRAHRWHEQHRPWHARGGYRGYRIPPERFHAHFGRGHWFRVHTLPVMVVEGNPRFQYGGFWFAMMDPWPETWAPNWYETDDVYVDYVDDGYYMYNRRHPGVSIAVNVSF